jgi:hypothetical protein
MVRVGPLLFAAEVDQDVSKPFNIILRSPDEAVTTMTEKAPHFTAGMVVVDSQTMPLRRVTAYRTTTSLRFKQVVVIFDTQSVLSSERGSKVCCSASCLTFWGGLLAPLTPVATRA